MMPVRLVLERFDRARPPDPEPDIASPPVPAAPPPLEPREATEASLAEGLADRIAALDRDLARFEAARDRQIRALCEAFAEAAAAVLPHLAETGFPSEIAAAAQALLHESGPPEPSLRAAPDLCAPLAAALAAQVPGLAGRLAPEADPELPPGHARLLWTEGGAEFRREALLDAARARLRARLPSHPTVGAPTETREDPS